VIENGRIKRFTDYYDMAIAFRELPTGGSATDPYTTTNNGDEATIRRCTTDGRRSLKPTILKASWRTMLPAMPSWPTMW